jgi:hypothetical protein
MNSLGRLLVGRNTQFSCHKQQTPNLQNYTETNLGLQNTTLGVLGVLVEEARNAHKTWLGNFMEDEREENLFLFPVQC